MVDLISLFATFFHEIKNHLVGLPTSEAIIFDIGLILIVSAVFAFIAVLSKQPLIASYVIAGIIIGPLVFGLVNNLEVVYAFSEIGVAFLLFTAGLEISFSKIKEASLKKILLIGTLQSILIFLVSYSLKGLLNLTSIEAAYVGIMLAFGSTMVGIKLLSDKKELVTLHGRIVLGVLLLEDLIAIIAILMITSGGVSFGNLSLTLIRFLALIVTAYLIQRFILKRAINFSAKSPELLFLTSLATLFFFLVLAHISGMSIVIGAFIAGVTLANSAYKTELESKVAPLRDFFAILFFVALGTQVSLEGMNQRIPLLIFMIVMGMIIKPLIDFILSRITGYGNRTSFSVGITLSQLSEFALIIGVLGISLNHIDSSILSSIILATIITMSITPYLLNHRNGLFEKLKSFIRLFEFLPKTEKKIFVEPGKKEILLIGGHRMGSIILKNLEKRKDKIIVLDYNPEIIKALRQKKISCVYGEVRSPEIFNHIEIKNLKIVISTAPQYEDNLYLLRTIKSINPQAKVILTGSRISETKDLYDAGADYVIMPKVLAGEELKHILSEKDHSLKKARIEHLKYLSDIHKILY